MPYEYLEDIATADVAFEARGKELEEVFRSSSDALMNVMVTDLGSIEPREEIAFTVKNRDLDLLLFNYLQEFIYFKDARRLLLLARTVAIREGEEGYALSATAEGEELDPEKHDLIVDVKAVTLYRFDLAQVDDGWKATVVLDI